MSVTIHVNGTSNSLAHKGSSGIAKSTLPDVCKTPSPAGPVPVPYPIIVSMSSDLVKGTTTVKVDGGNMAAIKGSELSRCTGDEPGTAGGVVSSTFIKEAAWILYSFDVKMDGKNACRLSDKLTMNHRNSACLAGFLQGPVNGDKVLVLECNPKWTPCQKEQMKAKAKAMDTAAKQKGSLDLMPNTKIARKMISKWRKAAKKFQAAYRKKAFANRSSSGPDRNHYSECGTRQARSRLEADHTTELQMGGDPGGPFMMLDRRVNSSSGSQIRNIRKDNPAGVSVVGVKTQGC